MSLAKKKCIDIILEQPKKKEEKRFCHRQCQIRHAYMELEEKKIVTFSKFF